jgi:26S proteasome regulatory subunit N2
MHDVLRHGACLGLGCAAMGTGDGAAFSSMRDVLFSEAAVASEGAALGIGLLLTGRGASWTCDVVSDEAGSAAAEMLAQAKDTAHEKTIRGIGVALALLCFGQEGAADGLVGQLCGDKDAVLRYGGMFALALAHAGTGSNAAVRRLLHVAVTDVSDDVRRAAVLGLGFVLCRAGREVPQLYLGFPPAAGEPPRSLRAFAALPIAARQLQAAAPRLLGVGAHADVRVDGGAGRVHGQRRRQLARHPPRRELRGVMA